MKKTHTIWVFMMEKLHKDDIKDYVDHSDAILNIGAKLTDSATAGFSYKFDINEVVMIKSSSIQIKRYD
ncbi:hypothetical protein [Streptococcus pneumoniae]|uniref:hypothetical protein n=1 Tax=Streptococcus pneumoniae TaxID=1313 RepID=UPI001CB784FA|nr:hypothetical protein [Streptococcus pneumoniae]